MELYVRSLRPRGNATAATVEKLAALVDSGALDSYDVVVWGDRAPPSAVRAHTPMGQYVCQRLAVFREWARRNDLTLGPAVREASIDSEITGETTAAVCLPAVLLAVYEDDHLQQVVPHDVDGESRSVPAFLMSLLDGEPAGSFVPVEHARVAAPTPGIVRRASETGPEEKVDSAVRESGRDESTDEPSLSTTHTGGDRRSRRETGATRRRFGVDPDDSDKHGPPLA